MKTLLQVDFPFGGPFGDQLATQLKELAASINQEPGLMWKIWTENAEAQEGGGIYLFDSKASASAYLEKHTARLKAMGVAEVRGKLFEINAPLSAINRGPFE